MTGKDAAERILHANGIYDVTVHHIPGNLTDHYNPANKTLGLSDATYNLSLIHIQMCIRDRNEHKDFEDYKRCKGLLFQQCRVGIANADDRYFKDVFKNATCKVETFGFCKEADLRAEDVNLVSRPGYLGVARCV